MAKNDTLFGQDMTLIRKVARPLYINQLKELGITYREAIDMDWGFAPFCEEIALELSVEDARN